jgi:branched-chain amino acid transport system ATP-binding protein
MARAGQRAGRMTAADPILRLDHVSKRFGGLTVIDDLSVSVRRGSCTALIGPNGAGKTTLFNLITGVYAVDGGRIVLDDADITLVPSRHRIRYGVARNFQNIRLMPHMTALENVLVGQHRRNGGLWGVLQPVGLLPGNRWREAARAALADAGLARYERMIAGALPYGIKKQVELIRALMAEPKLLLLDEPAAGLNPGETDRLRDHLTALCGRHAMTLLVVEHDMHFVGALCDRVVVLDFGRKIAEGTPAEIRADLHVREAYLGVDAASTPERRHAS